MNKTYRFHHAVTGVFLRGSFSSSVEADVVDSTPPDHVAVAIEVDPLTQRMDVQTGELVPYTPPPLVMVWDAPTARAERNRRMAESDWVTLRAMRTGQAIPAEWVAYMQALADWPDTPGFPDPSTLPTPPAS